MKKILWIGSYLVPSGFSKVNRSIIKHLAHKYEITMLDYDKVIKNGIQEFEGIKITGANGPNDLYAFKKLQQTDFNEFDIIFILNDPWGLSQFLHILKQRACKAKVVCYFPVDAKGHYREWYSYFDMVDVPVTYTDFGYDEVISVAPELKGRLQVIPHGIDTGTFYKLDIPKSELREKYFKSSKFNDSVIFLNANRNQPRKRLDITMHAFSKFLKGKDALLWMHCGNTDLNSMNISRLAERYDIVEQVRFTGNETGNITSAIQRIENEQVNIIYNLCDFGVNSSLGEGWGLCNTEHAATGAIQIVPAHSACQELFYDTGELINIVAEYTLDDIMTIGKIPDTNHMAHLMLKLYNAKRTMPLLIEERAKETLERFTLSHFHWDVIADKWDSIFSAL